MHWDDEGIVLALRRHGEGSAIVELLTREHGRHLGLIRGARREGAALQPGNSVIAHWRGRLPEHLGSYKIEPRRVRTAALVEDAAALAAVRAECALAALLLPEREPHGPLYDRLSALLDRLDSPAVWPSMLVRYEMTLLEELGFGLDLSRCAVNGTNDGLRYVSPVSGRAVSATAAAEHAPKLLTLPAFLLTADRSATPAELAQGLALTAHFIDRHLLRPHGRTLPAARAALPGALRRAKMLPQENQ